MLHKYYYEAYERIKIAPCDANGIREKHPSLSDRKSFLKQTTVTHCKPVAMVAALLEQKRRRKLPVAFELFRLKYPYRRKQQGLAVQLTP